MLSLKQRTRLADDILTEMRKDERKCNDIFKLQKECDCQPRIVYPENISFKEEGKIKMFSDKPIWRECATSSSVVKDGN